MANCFIGSTDLQSSCSGLDEGSGLRIMRSIRTGQGIFCLLNWSCLQSAINPGPAACVCRKSQRSRQSGCRHSQLCPDVPSDHTLHICPSHRACGEVGSGHDTQTLCQPHTNEKKGTGPFLVVQGLSVCLPMQGAQAQPLVQEDLTGLGADKPGCHTC